MFDFNGYMINPSTISLISPIESVQIKASPHDAHTQHGHLLWCVVDGHRITMTHTDLYHVQEARHRLLNEAIGRHKGFR